MTNPDAAGPRGIDHCVLPTADLAIARARCEALGFTVAPRGEHPFGTANHCIYFADGTFLEPLAVGDAGRVAEAVEAGNTFVARDALYRSRNAEEGFSALVAATDDAAADHAAFAGRGVSAGPILDFSRPFIAKDGRSDTASFRLAFAAEPAFPDAFFFSCQRINMPAVDRSALERHRNGVARMAGIVCVAREPASLGPVLSALFAAPAEDDADGSLHLEARNGRLSVLTPAAFAAAHGGPEDRASGLAAVRLAGDANGLRRLLDDNAVAYRTAGNRTVVPPAAGQGATLVFEEA